MDIKSYVADVGSLENKALFEQWYRAVSPDRREKVDRMRFDKDKRLSLGAGALLKIALKEAGLEDYTLTKEKNQKPCLDGMVDIKFNLSHSGNKVMCVISDCDIGCDVQKITNIDMDLAKRFFFSDEYDALRQCENSEERKDLFFRYWTLKESFMKVTGLGLMLPLDDFCIRINGEEVYVSQQLDHRRYYFYEFDPKDGYKYALCSADKPVGRIEMINRDFYDHPFHDFKIERQDIVTQL